MSDNRSASITRIPQLDILRSIAVIMVVCYHYHYDPVLGRMGWMGVDLFFVLSGFLISGLLYRDLELQGRISIGRFYLRRGLKLYPALYAFMLLALAVPVARHVMIADFVFLQNYLPHFWDHAWSLAVEEHFYLLLPILLTLMWQRSIQKYVPPLSVLLLVLCCVGRAFQCASGRDIDRVHAAEFTHLRIDSLSLGVALRYFWNFRPELLQRVSNRTLSILAVICLPLSCFSTQFSKPVAIFGVGLNAVGFGAVLLLALRFDIRSLLLQQIGEHSYSIYLWHFLILLIFHTTKTSLFHYFLYVALSVFIGIAMAQVVEFPVLRFRDEWIPAMIAESRASVARFG